MKFPPGDPLYIPEDAKLSRSDVARLARKLRNAARRAGSREDRHKANLRVHQMIEAGYDDEAIQLKKRRKHQ